MRRWFILLMIVLLPVRGWAGDFMGLQMAMAQGSPVAQSMPADCPMHASAETAVHHGNAGTPDHDEQGSKCSSCQLCTPAARLPDAPLLLGDVPARGILPGTRSEFISASLAPAVEPPIS
jgi:DUF2946 family protein